MTSVVTVSGAAGKSVVALAGTSWASSMGKPRRSATTCAWTPPDASQSSTTGATMLVVLNLAAASSPVHARTGLLSSPSTTAISGSCRRARDCHARPTSMSQAPQTRRRPMRPSLCEPTLSHRCPPHGNVLVTWCISRRQVLARIVLNHRLSQLECSWNTTEVNLVF